MLGYTTLYTTLTTDTVMLGYTLTVSQHWLLKCAVQSSWTVFREDTRFVKLTQTAGEDPVRSSNVCASSDGF